MFFIRSGALAACFCGLIAAGFAAASCQAGEPFSVQPAVHHSVSQPMNVTPVSHRHYGGVSYGYRGYGVGYGGYSGYRSYGYYGGGYAPRYAYSGYSPYAGYSPYLSVGYRPYYTQPVGYYRSAYYSYPSYRTFGYPYSYGGLYTTGYYGGGYGLGYGAVYAPSYGSVYAAAPVISTPIVSTPYVYGGFYNYPQYASTCGCGW